MRTRPRAPCRACRLHAARRAPQEQRGTQSRSTFWPTYVPRSGAQLATLAVKSREEASGKITTGKSTIHPQWPERQAGGRGEWKTLAPIVCGSMKIGHSPDHVIHRDEVDVRKWMRDRNRKLGWLVDNVEKVFVSECRRRKVSPIEHRLQMG